MNSFFVWVNPHGVAINILSHRWISLPGTVVRPDPGPSPRPATKMPGMRVESCSGREKVWGDFKPKFQTLNSEVNWSELPGPNAQLPPQKVISSY